MPRFCLIAVRTASSSDNFIALGSFTSLPVSAVTGAVACASCVVLVVVVCVCCARPAVAAIARDAIEISRRTAVMYFLLDKPVVRTAAWRVSLNSDRRAESGADCTGSGHGRAREMARCEVSWLVLDQRRHDIFTDWKLRDGAARVEHASARRIERRRDVALEEDARLACRRIGNRHRGEEI